MEPISKALTKRAPEPEVLHPNDLDTLSSQIQDEMAGAIEGVLNKFIVGEMDMRRKAMVLQICNAVVGVKLGTIEHALEPLMVSQAELKVVRDYNVQTGHINDEDDLIASLFSTLLGRNNNLRVVKLKPEFKSGIEQMQYDHDVGGPRVEKVVRPRTRKKKEA